MAKLTTTRRNALARVSQAQHEGKISDSGAAQVRSKANRILRGG